MGNMESASSSGVADDDTDDAVNNGADIRVRFIVQRRRGCVEGTTNEEEDE